MKRAFIVVLISFLYGGCSKAEVEKNEDEHTDNAQIQVVKIGREAQEQSPMRSE